MSITDAVSGLGISTVRQSARRQVAIALALVLILLAAAAALLLVRGVAGQIEDVMGTYEVRKEARELIIAVTDAETGQRGYLLTRDARYLQPYLSALGEIEAHHASLAKAAEGDAERTEAIARLREPLRLKQEEMAATVALAEQNQMAAALEMLRSDTGRQLMDELRGIIRAFIAQEDERLAQRNGQVVTYRQGLVIAILAALAASAILAYMLLTRTQQEVSSLSRTREALENQNEELEARVRERTAEAEEARAHAERERERVEALLQDTNHRIGNSLATVSSLLGLQLSRSKSDEVKQALEAARLRVHAIASGHRRLRLGADLETTRADEFLDSVVDDLRSTQPAAGRVVIVTEFEPLTINARDATTIGVVLGELVTNALKHGFGDQQGGHVWTRLVRSETGVITLTVEDDGHGIPLEVKTAEKGLGSLIVRQLAQQFGGAPTYHARPRGGTVVSVALPTLDPELQPQPAT